jgi:hypothetical protein
MRTLFITIPVVTLIAGLVGFIITYPTSEQVAFARIFIDLGVMISLLCAIWTIPKPAVLRTGEIADALRDLVRGRYDKRLADKDFGDLGEIALAFNELAGSLSDSRDLDTSYLRYKNVSKDGTESRPVRDENFSHHPELGPVKPLPLRAETFAAEQQAKEAKRLREDEENPSPKELLRDVPNTKESVSDVHGLYQRFQDAHQNQSSGVEFDVFRSMIERTKKDLLATHQCVDVRFEVVMERGEVALQPRLVR